MATSSAAYTSLVMDDSPATEAWATRSKRDFSWRAWVGVIVSVEVIHAILVLTWVLWSRSFLIFEKPISRQYHELHKYNHVMFFDESDYANRNSNDTLWRNLFPEAQGIVSIDRSSFIRPEQESLASPLEPNQMLYQVSIFHHLHCLEMVKNTLLDAISQEEAFIGGPQGDAAHSLHCIDWLRQALMCNADLSLDATENYRAFGQDSKHQCRDFSKIYEWASAHGYKGSLDELRKLGMP